MKQIQEDRVQNPAGSVLLLCPPWPRTGSARIFEAQAQFYALAGFHVRVLVVGYQNPPLDAEDYWSKAVAYFRLPSIRKVDVLQARHPMRRAWPFSLSRWRFAGRPTQLRIHAEYAASATMPESWWSDLVGERLEIVHCNHSFNALAARKLCTRLTQLTGHQPALVVETHDIQAAIWHQTRTINMWSGRVDRPERLVQDEIELLSDANLLIHISETDLDHFRAKLPNLQHRFVPAVFLESRICP